MIPLESVLRHKTGKRRRVRKKVYQQQQQHQDHQSRPNNIREVIDSMGAATSNQGAKRAISATSAPLPSSGVTVARNRGAGKGKPPIGRGEIADEAGKEIDQN